MTSAAATAGARGKLMPLVIGAVGVVYGDIGTSPLYTLRTAFTGSYGLSLTPANVLGVLSVIVWALVIVVTLKYITLIMRADNRGEGGILALTALVSRGIEDRARMRWWLVGLGIFGAAMFYGDGMITPAITVLGAVEGLGVIAPALHPFIVPIAVIILVALFAIQRSGTARLGAVFGPVMVVWFIVLAVLGGLEIARGPHVLAAFDPMYAVRFVGGNPVVAFVAFGAVVLAVTGTEALYADMGHFGKTPIRRAWVFFVMPALLLNYFGQGALILNDPAAIQNPFYLLAPEWGRVPLLILATAAAIIASQAVISGAFSLTRAAIQMGYCPRLTILHTSERAIGQIYVPFINWMLLIAIIALVIGFRNSDNLAGAYGIAVTMAMLIDSILIFVVMRRLWDWPVWIAILITHAALADRPDIPRVERAQDPRRRLVPAPDRRHRVHAADDVEERPVAADAASVGRRDAARPLHPEHRGVTADARRRHGRVPDVDAQPRPARAAAQPEAQQGAARARGIPDDRHARHSVRARRGAR